MDLRGKTAVVTGGARGMGRAYRERLAIRGADVVIVDRIPDDAHKLAETMLGSGRKMAVVADVSEPIQIDAVAKSVKGGFTRSGA
jgi:NAD(P)-dependent dehydrogenase (short-subunit alcohol dehydrogenase family)